MIELRLEFSTAKAIVQLQSISRATSSRKFSASETTVEEGRKQTPKVHTTKKQDFANFNSLRNCRFLFIADISGCAVPSLGL